MVNLRWPPPPGGGGPAPYGPGNTGPRTGRPTLPEPPTDMYRTPHGVTLECLATGHGQPVTVFAHGLGNGISDTRPLGSGVTGRKIFFQFRGHGRSDSPPGPWDYADLARDLRAIADLTAASQALGASLGAGALVRLLADHPTRFNRVVFFLPAVLDQPRPDAARDRLGALLDAIASGDSSAVAEAVGLDIPPAARDLPAAWSYLRTRIDQLLRDGLGSGLETLPDQIAIPDRAVLRAVTVPALVIGCRGDELHPVGVAEDLAAALPEATLHVYDKPGVLWLQRADLRERIASFLNPPTP